MAHAAISRRVPLVHTRRRNKKDRVNQRKKNDSGVPMDVRIIYHFDMETKAIETVAILRELNMAIERKYIGMRFNAEITG